MTCYLEGHGKALNMRQEKNVLLNSDTVTGLCWCMICDVQIIFKNSVYAH